MCSPRPRSRRTLGQLDLAGMSSRFFADPEAMAPAARALAAMLPKLLATVEDGRARRTLARLIPRLVGGPAAGRVMARALRSLVEGGRHQEVFGFILGAAETGAGGAGGGAAPGDRGPGARTGRAAGGLGARRLGGAAGADADQRRTRQDAGRRLGTARGVRRVDAPRDRADGGGPGAGGGDWAGGAAGGRARDGAGVAVRHLVAAAVGAGGGCEPAERPYGRVPGGRAGQPRDAAGDRCRARGRGCSAAAEGC